MLNDLRYALRMLLKSPGFTVVAVLTLAIGIGANTSLFTAIDAMMFRPLPVPEANRLVYLTSGATDLFEFLFFERLGENVTTLPGLAAAQNGAPRREVNLPGADVTEAEPVAAQGVSGNFFSVLGVPAQIGRTITLDDDRPGTPQPVVVISHAYWQRRFMSDPAVLGRDIQLDDVRATIVGVMPVGFAGFDIGAKPDIWWPVQMVTRLSARDAGRLEAGAQWLVLLGRLRPDTSLEQAQSEIRLLVHQETEERIARNPNLPETERQQMLSQVYDLHSGVAGFLGARVRLQQPMAVLMAAVGIALLIACANVAGLMLARAAARQREFAVRVAMGAGRVRIIRQLLTESLLLAFAAGALGLLFSLWGTRVLAIYLSQSDATVPLEPDSRMLLFTVGVSLLTGLLFGLVPALRLRHGDLISSIKHQGTTVAGSTRSRLQTVFVAAQIAMSVLLLAGAGLFVRTLNNLRTLDMGFEPENLVSFAIDPGRWRPENPAQMSALLRRVLEELEPLRDVNVTSIGGAGMLSGNGYNTDFAVDGYTPVPDEALRARVVFAGPSFFQTLDIPLVRGREFTLADEPAPSPQGALTPANVVILGQEMAQRFFGDADPVGRFITRTGPNGQQRLEIIGVAADTKYSRNLRERAPLQFYLPFFGAVMRMPPTFYLRTQRSAAALAPEIRRIVKQIQPLANIRDLRSMDEVIDRLLVRERIIAELVGFISLFALLLSSLGVYGMLAYGVAHRTREIGVRMALGASRQSVIRLVLRQGLRLTLVGCALGVASAAMLSRFIASLLFGVQPTDPLTFIGVTGLLLVVALLACWMPAYRAARVDPMVALRSE